jgi:hypothetical protein
MLQVLKSMNITMTWDIQFFMAMFIFIAYMIFLFWNFHLRTDSPICHSEMFSEWTKPYILLVVGGSVGQLIVQIFRVFVQIQGYSLEGKLRHPNATKLMLFICVVQSLSLICTYQQYFNYTCEDFLGVRTSPFMWWEWLTTVPSIFFLVSMLDVKRSTMSVKDIRTEVLGGISIFFLFSGNIPMPKWLHVILFSLANVCMVSATSYQQYYTFVEYLTAKDAYDRNVNEKKSIASIRKEIFDDIGIAQCKLNSAVFITIIYAIFPCVYYSKVFDLIDHDTCYVLMFTAALMARILFMQLISDSHVNILDPNKFLLLEEKKKAEESRSMFLRYVFHEVRVPLNSVSLGLQILQDSVHLNCVERETIAMMKDATNFMAETLNDVLSLQKVEEGKLELEYKLFSPNTLAMDVINNFR